MAFYLCPPPPIWMICAPVLFVVSGPVPLTDILCCASSPRGSALDVTKECITSECVVCCVWAVKRTGETFRDVLAGRFPRVHAFHCSYTPPLVPFNRTSGKLRCSFVDRFLKKINIMISLFIEGLQKWIKNHNIINLFPQISIFSTFINRLTWQDSISRFTGHLKR